MSTYIPFTEEEKLRAAAVDLPTFLGNRNIKLKRSGGEYRLESDPYVTVRGSEWYDQAEQHGGNAISFVKRFYNLGFPDAVSLLLDGNHTQPGEARHPPAGNRRPVRPEPAKTEAQPEKKETAPFVLPPAHPDMEWSYGYLCGERHIPAELVTHFAGAGLLYESAEPVEDIGAVFHHAVFVGMDGQGVPRHAHKRSLNYRGNGYRGNITGSEPAYSFHSFGLPPAKGGSGNLYVFEAPIDLLSFIALHPEGWQRHSYVALCGIAEHAVLWALEENPGIGQVYLCLDHDERGIEGAGRLGDILRERAGVEIAPLLPEYADWNESLKAKLGQPAQPARPHPQITLFTASAQKLAGRLGGKTPVKTMNFDQMENAVRQIQAHIRAKRYDSARQAAGAAVPHWLAAAKQQYGQLGRTHTTEELCDELIDRFAPHRNRRHPKTQAGELLQTATELRRQAAAPGVFAPMDQESFADACMDMAVRCAGLAVKIQLDEPKHEQAQAGPAMTMA